MAQIVLASFLLVRKEETVKYIVKNLDNVFDKAQASKDNKALAGLTDVIQLSFSCCGKDGLDFYNGKALPKSCCGWEDQKKSDVCEKSRDASNGELNRQGCHEAYTTWLKGQVQTVVIALFAASLVQLIAVTFSCYLSKSV